MRLFVGVYPDQKAVEAWRKFQRTAPAWPLRWVDEASLHFTLVFLGETAPALEEKISGVLKRIADQTPPFQLALGNGGVFPEKGSPSVFWIGLKEDASDLIELARVAALEFKNLGFKLEKRDYHPHLTVARPKQDARFGAGFQSDFIKWASPFSSDPFQVTQLALVQSHPGPGGSHYQIRATFPFRHSAT